MRPLTSDEQRALLAGLLFKLCRPCAAYVRITYARNVPIAHIMGELEFCPVCRAALERNPCAA